MIIAGRPSKVKDASMSDSLEYQENLVAQDAVENDFTAPLFDGCTCLVWKNRRHVKNYLQRISKNIFKYSQYTGSAIQNLSKL